MSYTREVNVNEEQIASFLADALGRVENATEAEIQALDKIQKLYKKNVPFSRRKYVTAYLVKQSLGRGGRFNRDRNERFGRERDRERGERFNRTERNERNERNSERRERTESREEPRERPPRTQIDPALATSIFIGIGRNRRVFPRDLVGLLVSVAGLERDRIGDIKVLANYSFIQLFTEDCEKAIKALNGYDYRGRTLSVSYSSRQKEEAASQEETQSGAEDYIPANVSNEGHAVAEENVATAQIAAEQSAFASKQVTEPAQETQSAPAPVSSSTPVSSEPVAPYSETTDDGQVKSHFGNGEAY
ncbi:MAG: DbpA RNA binding domain-containing protein [Treponema sp.]|nr:DbpA RNA binding domain-containing protein [Treponema sp.]